MALMSSRTAQLRRIYSQITSIHSENMADKPAEVAAAREKLEGKRMLHINSTGGGEAWLTYGINSADQVRRHGEVPPGQRSRARATIQLTRAKDGGYAAGMYRSRYVGFDHHGGGYAIEEETDEATIAQEAMAKFTIEKVRFIDPYIAVENKC